MTFFIKYSLEGEGCLEVEADDTASAELLFNRLGLDELVANADFTGGVDVLEIVGQDDDGG
jgi:hypothetical protein